MLEGRPVEQRQQLLAAFTDIIMDVLAVERGMVRGRFIQVHPDDWAIGGRPRRLNDRARKIPFRAPTSGASVDPA